MMGRLFAGILVFGLLSGCIGREYRPVFPYRVVCGETQGRLADVVSEWMRHDWRPIGGVVYRDGQADFRWCQAMTKGDA